MRTHRGRVLPFASQVPQIKPASQVPPEDEFEQVSPICQQSNRNINKSNYINYSTFSRKKEKIMYLKTGSNRKQ